MPSVQNGGCRLSRFDLGADFHVLTSFRWLVIERQSRMAAIDCPALISVRTFIVVTSLLCCGRRDETFQGLRTVKEKSSTGSVEPSLSPLRATM